MNEIDVETEFEAEFLAVLDYLLNLGHEILVDNITGYANGNSFDLDGRFRVKILPTVIHDIIRYSDIEYLDPLWDVDPREVVAVDGNILESTFIHVQSYHILENARGGKRL
jgi:hypothetical protein